MSAGSAEFLGEPRGWVRLEYASYYVHYGCEEGALSMITISRLIS